jgi:nickel-dependent lactate racemase
VEAQGKETTGMGCHHNNILREEIDEAASFAGLDFLINVVVNGKGETTKLFCGDMLTAHGKAVEVAKEIYATTSIPHDKQIAVVNAFSKPNEMAIAILLGVQSLKNASGSVVVLADTPEGQVVHYLVGRFGTGYGGRQYPVASLPDSVQLIIVTEYPDRTLADWFTNPDRCIFKRNWQETLELLQETHGPGSQVAVMPNATMQYFPNA